MDTLDGRCSNKMQTKREAPHANSVWQPPLYGQDVNLSRLAIGLMSGTSTDGIDAALVEITGCGTETRVTLKAFLTLPFSAEERDFILKLQKGDTGGSEALCMLHFYLGSRSADACEAVCKAANVALQEIAFVGSHGQTVYHAPQAVPFLGKPVRGTLQIGEASMIAQRMGCPVVSDFRVRDLAAGGDGAPLVPYTEFLLYRSESETVALQNIGGIGNITLLPKNCTREEVLAFDTGPGNMVMDALVQRITQGAMCFDEGGKLAAQAHVHPELLAWMQNDAYLQRKPPKSTGRERYGSAYVDALCKQAQQLGCCLSDVLATATCFTASCIAAGIHNFCPTQPNRLIVGGGGSYNPTLLHHLAVYLPEVEVVTNEDLGMRSDAKEAIAFAILANETLHGICNNMPTATGALQPVVMGKITL